MRVRRQIAGCNRCQARVTMEAEKGQFFLCDFLLQDGSVQWKSRQNGSAQCKWC